MIVKCCNCGKKFSKFKSQIYKKRVFCSYPCFQKFRVGQTKNHDFFDNINTEGKAYWLGFIYADGHISLPKRKQRIIKLDLSQKDIDHLNKFAFIFDVKVKKYISELKYKKAVCNITSKNIWEKLFEIGLSNKTYEYKLDLEKIPNDLLSHFIRGYFDGDGGLCYNKKTRNFSVQIIGLEKFLYEIRDIIVSEIGISKSKLIRCVNTDVVKRLSWSGSEQLIKLKEWLYKDATVFMERKKDLFEKIKIKEKSATGYRGVYKSHWKNGRYCATIYNNKKPNHLGSFDTKEEAALAFDKALIKFGKPRYRLNFPESIKRRD